MNKNFSTNDFRDYLREEVLKVCEKNNLNIDNHTQATEAFDLWLAAYLKDNNRYIDLRMVSFPTDSLESISYFDNVGIIEWEEWSLSEVLYPNDYYYYQVKSSSNQVDITLKEKSYYFGEQFSIGDNNFDGSIDVIDIILIINISIDIYIPSNEEFAASDANQDGSVNVLDIIELINIIISN